MNKTFKFKAGEDSLIYTYTQSDDYSGLVTWKGCPDSGTSYPHSKVEELVALDYWTLVPSEEPKPNKLVLTEQQFETLMNLPIVKASYQYYLQDTSTIKDGMVISKSTVRSIIHAGIEYVVETNE